MLWKGLLADTRLAVHSSARSTARCMDICSSNRRGHRLGPPAARKRQAVCSDPARHAGDRRVPTVSMHERAQPPAPQRTLAVSGALVQGKPNVGMTVSAAGCAHDCQTVWGWLGDPGDNMWCD